MIDESLIHPDLLKIFNEVKKEFNCKIICGHRGQEEQNRVFKIGKSKLNFPHSKHNSIPSKAIDVCPLPIDWTNTDAFKKLGQIFKDKANELNIKISWGGDWQWKDFPHFEL
jgi:hypothetical protein